MTDKPRPGGVGDIGTTRVARIGYGAMQLFEAASQDATTVLRRAVELGVNHIDTASFYGPGEVNRRIPRPSPPFPTTSYDRIPVVNLRRMDLGPGVAPEGDQIVDLDDQLAEMIALRDEGKIGAIGISAVPHDVVRRALPAGIACVQNAYSLLDVNSASHRPRSGWCGCWRTRRTRC